MAGLTLTDYIDRRLRALHTDQKELAAAAGIPHSWVRNFKAGRIKERPDPDRVRKLAGGLRVPEAELWRRIGRMDMVAELHGEQPTADDPTPEWAHRLETAISDLQERVEVLARAQADQQEFLGGEIGEVAALVRALSPSDSASEGSETGQVGHPAETTNGRAGR